MISRTVFVTGATGYLGGALLPRAELIPASRAGARRLGLVTRAQMVRALAAAVESRPDGLRVVDVPAIRAA